MNHAYHLAQFNLGLARFPLEDPRMEGFVSRLDEINQLADNTPGFVWRLKAENPSKPVQGPFADERLVLTLSVWQDIESLRAYVYRSRHAEPLSKRAQWFEPHGKTANLVLWWIPAGSLPNVWQGNARLTYLRRHGPRAHAFTFKSPFPPPTFTANRAAEDPVVSAP